MIFSPARLVATIALLCGIAVSAQAAESAPATTSRVTASLISDTDAVEAGHPFRLALHLRIAQGWHTYWRNPGDAGAAPEIEWTLPQGVSAGPIAWPAPMRMLEGPLTTFGYEGDVALPVAISAARLAPGAPLEISTHATWLVCKNICVPEEGNFRLSLPQGAPAPSAEAVVFRAADAAMPAKLPWTATAAQDGTLTVAGPEISPRLVRSAEFIPDSWGIVQGASPPAVIGDGALSIALKPDEKFRPGQPLDGVLTVTDGSGLESHYIVSAKPGADAPDSSGTGFPGIGQALWLAFAGGLILNLMPCVFPILAMKTMALARLSHGHRREARLHGLSYAAGVLTCFAALAGLLLAARAGGSQAGWGFQFQSPAFVAAMAWLMLAVGLNFSGVFSLDFSSGAGVGSRLASSGGMAGSFFTGLLAVLVATPCTAPYMAVAVGAALAAPPAATLAVFLCLGAGLAAPFLALSFAPGVSRIMPRPGMWMERLRQALAFPMYAAAAWLLWVVSQEGGSDAVLTTAAGAVLVGFAAWVWRWSRESLGRARPALRALAGISAVGLVALLVGVANEAAVEPAAVASESGSDAEAFSPARLAELRAQGRPVFVNMTAAWCVTCLVNERVALSSDPVRRAFAQRNVAYLKGDWTRQDPAISSFLHAHARDGVPLYVFFPASGAVAKPTVLPQILTTSEVLSAIGAG